MDNRTVKTINPKQQLIDEIGRIEGLSRTEKWKAAQKFVLKINKNAKADHDAIVKEVKEKKESMKSDFAASKEGWRHGLRMPQSVLLTLELFDPELKESVRKDVAAQKKELKKLVRTFPEYALPRRF